MTDATHPDDRDPDHDPIGPRLGRPGHGAAAPRPIASANPMPNGLVLGEPGRRWRLLASVVSAARAVRLPVLVVAAGPSAVEAMEVPGIRGLPVSVAGRPNDSRPYRRAIERFLDGDPVEAGGRSLAARRATEGRSRKGGVPVEVVSEGASSGGAASGARGPGSMASGPLSSGRGGAAAVLAPAGTGVAEVAWFLLRETLQRLRPDGAVAAGAAPLLPKSEAAVPVVPGLPGPVVLERTEAGPKPLPPRCPLPRGERPRALVVLDDAGAWPDPRGRIGMLVTQAAGLGIQVWSGAAGDVALIDALGPAMAAVLSEAGTVVDLRGTPG